MGCSFFSESLNVFYLSLFSSIYPTALPSDASAVLALTPSYQCVTVSIAHFAYLIAMHEIHVYAQSPSLPEIATILNSGSLATLNRQTRYHLYDDHSHLCAVIKPQT